MGKERRHVQVISAKNRPRGRDPRFLTYPPANGSNHSVFHERRKDEFRGVHEAEASLISVVGNIAHSMGSMFGQSCRNATEQSNSLAR
jgi:hypothetical protein